MKEPENKQSDVIEVQFKRERKDYFRNRQGLKIKVGDYVIVEVDRGEDLGQVTETGDVAGRKMPDKKGSLGIIRRMASPHETEKLGRMSEKEGEAFEVCEKKVAEHGLEMKLVDAEWQFDGNKVIFYFTADKRVDFRQLVKDLAAVFRTRIELKQIGVRDEARRLGGCGRCGYKLCCTSFISEFEPVTLRAAKDQHLSLNPSQISGLCGRLMCCLMYEREFYKKQTRKFPKEGKLFCTGEGREERVSAVDLFQEEVELVNREGYKRRVPLEEFSATATECPRRSGNRHQHDNCKNEQDKQE
ncbi:MAG: stage 0 sporulation protein [Candidatus Glassbacteria bacterium]|nr:stage 0 sporulation protein [Candidatus Glassbacteria bacterium]